MSSEAVPDPQFDRPKMLDRLFNRLFGTLVGLGVGFRHNYLLEVRGRRTGRFYATPVDVLTLDGKRYLVAPRGTTQWVRNAEIAQHVVLRRGRSREECALAPVPDAEKPAILKAYLDRFSTTVQRFFPVRAGSPASEFAPLVSHYPVFEIR